jgi:hypothetical protein
MTLPAFGHLAADRGIRVAEPIGRIVSIDKGRHLIVGQREGKGKTSDLVLIGKCLEHSKVADRYDWNVWLDTSFPHVVFIAGTRGSGKSFDIGVLVEGLLLPPSSNVRTDGPAPAVVLFDLQNQFWTLARAPDADLEEDRNHVKGLDAWGLKPGRLDAVRLFIPPADPKLIGSEQELAIATTDLTVDDLCSFWSLDRYTPQGNLLAMAWQKVAQTGYVATGNGPNREGGPRQVDPSESFELGDIIACLSTDQEIQETIASQVIDALRWRVQSLERVGIFRATGLPVRDLISEGKATILLLRSLDDPTKALISGLLLRKIYTVMGDHHTRRRALRRLKRPQDGKDSLPNRVWAVVDEAHVVCPTDRDSPATRSVTEYVKRGRDAGLSLVLATQQPSAIDSKVLSQVDLALIHRLTFEGDISAALARIPSYLPGRYTIGTSQKEPRAIIRLLESGEAVLGDSQADRAFIVQVRPRLTAHGGSEPR